MKKCELGLCVKNRTQQYIAFPSIFPEKRINKNPNRIFIFWKILKLKNIKVGHKIKNPVTGRVFTVTKKILDSRDPPEYIIKSVDGHKEFQVFWTWLKDWEV